MIDSTIWHDATILDNVQSKQTVFVKTAIGTAVCFYSKVSNSPGCHRCYIGLPRDAVVSVRLADNTRPSSPYKYVVEELWYDVDYSVEESGTLENWRPVSRGENTRYVGSIVRLCGCAVFANALTSQGLHEGDQVTFQLERHKYKFWQAANIQTTIDQEIFEVEE